MALILRPDGSCRRLPRPTVMTFRWELKRIVGESAPAGEDYIEIRRTKDGRMMVLDKSGKLIGLQRNDQATALINLPTPKDIAALRLLLGTDWFILGPDLQEEAETTYLAQSWCVKRARLSKSRNGNACSAMGKPSKRF